MSKAGQNTFSGIGLQADIALLKLLESYQSSEFEKITMEGDAWEDFTLFFENRTESYEVKWVKALTYGGVQKIIRKELKKSSKDNFKFKIACKTLGAPFRKDVEFLKKSLYYWSLFNKSKSLEKNDVVKRFLKKRWNAEEIKFLLTVDFEEYEAEKQIEDKIYEHLRISIDTFLAPEDLSSVVAETFRNLMEAGRAGASISKKEFVDALSNFQKNLADKSESFRPELVIKEKTENLENFLKDETEFKKLDHPRFLTPITYPKNRRLVLYIAEALIKNNFSMKTIAFFLEKVLIKNAFQFSCIRIFKTRLDQERLDGNYFVEFLNENFQRFVGEFVVREVYEILLALVKNKSDRNLSKNVLRFLEKHSLRTFEQKLSTSRNQADRYSEEFLPELIEVIGTHLGGNESYLRFLFQHYDFTGDSHSNVTETPHRHFGWLREYLKGDLRRRLSEVIKQLSKQYRVKYGIYRGRELAGSGVGYFGSYSIDDTGISRLVFSPLYCELLESDPKLYWTFLRSKVFRKTAVSPANPVFLKRATTHSLVAVVSGSGYSRAHVALAKKFLRAVVSEPQGIPGTSEIVFNELRSRAGEVGLQDFIFELIQIDAKKYKQKFLPTNVLVLETVVALTLANYRPAEDLLLNWVKNPKFRSLHEFIDLIRIISSKDIYSLGSPGFGEKLLAAIDVPALLGSKNSRAGFDVAFVERPVASLLQTNPGALKSLLSPFLVGANATEASQDYIGSVLYYIKAPHTVIIYESLLDIFGGGLKASSFIGSARHFKAGLIQLGQALASETEFERAKKICDLIAADPDPVTSNEPSDSNLHLKVKQGKTENVITSVRGHACWLVKQIVGSNDPKLMKYAIEKTKFLLDIDGSFARSMGYPETNYYVLSQAMIPLASLAHPARRKELNQFEPGLGDSVMKLGTDVLRWTKAASLAGADPQEIAKRLVVVFDNLRDASSDIADELLEYLEAHEVDDSAHLFIFFALFRDRMTQLPKFEGDKFRQRLMRLCETDNALRSSIGWHFWKIISSEPKNLELSSRLEPYWRAFLKKYSGSAFDRLAMVLEHRIEEGSNYASDRDVFFDALKVEIEALKSGQASYPRLSLYKIVETMFDRSRADFLRVANIILSESDFAAGTNPMGFHIPDLSKKFQSIDCNELAPSAKSDYEQVREFLDKMEALN